MNQETHCRNGHELQGEYVKPNGARECLICRRETARRGYHARREEILARRAENPEPRLPKIWRNMIDRCHNPKHKSFRHYSGRGIRVCAEWRASQTEFIAWAEANGHAAGLVIDRIDNDLGYEPTNCRWVTHKQNNNNKSNTLILESGGVKLPLTAWAARNGVKEDTIRKRLYDGWSPERAVMNLKELMP